mmetsp:Transcript_8912/g.7957  ORF Transcript_8912/g.7957 Transcript_8912/m.7957 type:complete len:152 (-) Transcript_8912:10-465(-)
MSREYDDGKNQYKKRHRTKQEQETRHILSNDLLKHYNVDEAKYAKAQANTGGINYKMGNHETNVKDRVIDNALIDSIFNRKEYDAIKLNNQSDNRITYQEQVDLIGIRFDCAKSMRKQTEEKTYLQMQKDFFKIADKKLNVDRREWKLLKK